MAFLILKVNLKDICKNFHSSMVLQHFQRILFLLSSNLENPANKENRNRKVELKE